MKQSSPCDKNSYTLFAKEEEVIGHARQMQEMLREVASGVNSLADAYAKQFHEQQRMLRLSDRIQLELHRANQKLAEQAEELKGLNLALSAEISQRKKLEQELVTLATTDSLTGMLTRRHFFELGTRELKRQSRTGSSLSVILIDLDHFKLINDCHGHAAGDKVLSAIGELCRTQLREVDLVGRLGGEEFGVLLPDAGFEAAQQIAERLRQATAEFSFSYQQAQITVTMSLGISEVDHKETVLQNALTRADKALYLAKEQGRNQCVVWERLLAGEQYQDTPPCTCVSQKADKIGN